jgi:hypothetical protein
MVMRLSLQELRKIIQEILQETKNTAGSYPEESYDMELTDDPKYKQDSVYVPNDIKKKINKWSQDMGLSTKGKKK